MFDYIFVTDTHLGEDNSSNFWLNITENLFDELISQCIQYDINTVIHLGDFFDNRKSINVLTMNKALEICQKFEDAQIHLYIIKGNHDQYYTNQTYPNSISYLNLYNYIHIIDEKPEVLDNYILIPWGYSISEISEQYIPLGHFEINGFVTNYSGNVQKGASLDKKHFSKFKQVYSGHFHTPSEDGNIKYLGSAFAMDFNDVNSVRGYYLVKNTGELIFQEYKQAPKFISITTDDEIKEGVIENNIVKLTFLQDYGNIKNEKIIQEVKNLYPVKLLINYKIDIDDSEIELEETEIESNREILMQYIDKTKLSVKKPTLKKMVEKLEKGEI